VFAHKNLESLNCGRSKRAPMKIFLLQN